MMQEAIFSSQVSSTKKAAVLSQLYFVPGAGIEPAWVAPLVFETSASTYSATQA